MSASVKTKICPAMSLFSYQKKFISSEISLFSSLKKYSLTTSRWCFISLDTNFVALLPRDSSFDMLFSKMSAPVSSCFFIPFILPTSWKNAESFNRVISLNSVKKVFFPKFFKIFLWIVDLISSFFLETVPYTQGFLMNA